jgi:hypothetical protein
VIAESYLDHDVRALSGTTCWFSILFDRAIAAARRAGRNVDTVGEIWPNLRALFGGGVQADPYRKLIDERVGHTTVLVDNYNATEGGIFAATARLGDDSMMMIPDRGVFFEFVPRADHGKPNARRYALWEVEVDQVDVHSGLVGGGQLGQGIFAAHALEHGMFHALAAVDQSAEEHAGGGVVFDDADIHFLGTRTRLVVRKRSRRSALTTPGLAGGGAPRVA